VDVTDGKERIQNERKVNLTSVIDEVQVEREEAKEGEDEEMLNRMLLRYASSKVC
jgi:hypothetical protein